MGGMGWRTEDAGVSRLVEREFWRPQSTNGESDGWGGTMFRSGTRLFLPFLNRRWDALVLNLGKVQTFPPLKFRTYCGSGVGW